MKSGTKPTPIDKRDYSFHHSFGSIGVDASTLPANFDVDAGLTMPNQEIAQPMYSPPAPALPEGCTDYASSELCIDQDQKIYSPMLLENVDHANANGGIDVRTALATAVTVFKRSAYFNVSPAGALDWFDAVRVAIWINQPERRSVSVGSIWYPEWEGNTDSSGMLEMPSQLTLDGPWHNWKVSGWVTIGGYLYLKGKSWNGPAFGAQGWCYVSRAVFNTAMSVPGTCAFTISELDPPVITNFGFVSQFVGWFLNLIGYIPTAGATQQKSWWSKLGDIIEETFGGDAYAPAPTPPMANNITIEPPAVPTKENPDVLVAWGSQQNNYHNTRVLCDLSSLSLEGKNIICGCIYQESTFLNYLPDGQPVKHENLNDNGTLASTDWGICQINDYYHIAPHGSPFASVDFVLANPQAQVQFMIDMYKSGRLSMWDSYLHNSYLKWLQNDSPMWQLATLP